MIMKPGATPKYNMLMDSGLLSRQARNVFSSLFRLLGRVVKPPEGTASATGFKFTKLMKSIV
jgi:hypothetical protein